MNSNENLLSAGYEVFISILIVFILASVFSIIQHNLPFAYKPFEHDVNTIRDLVIAAIIIATTGIGVIVIRVKLLFRQGSSENYY